jgi:hypothetical protein
MITGLPTFTSGILTSAQLNSIVAALEAKFAGQIGPSDLSWPMQAGGNIDMSNYEIVGLGQFWGIYNVKERASGQSFQDLLTALGVAGGGVVVVPSAHTEPLPAAGISIPANVTIVGDGYSSALQIHATPDAGAAALSVDGDNCRIRNLRLLGRTTANENLIEFDNVDYCVMDRVWIDSAGTDPHVDIIGGCDGTTIRNCMFTGGGDSVKQHLIRITGASNTKLYNNYFKDWSNAAIRVLPAGGASVSNLMIVGNYFVRNNTLGSLMTEYQTIYCDNTNAVTTAINIKIQGNLFAGENVGGVYFDDFDAINLTKNIMYCSSIVPVVHLRNGSKAVITNNHMLNVGDNGTTLPGGDGIIIGVVQDGRTAVASRTVEQFTDFIISGNSVISGGYPLAMAAGAGPLRAVIRGNQLLCWDLDAPNLPAMSIWNLGAANTTVATHLVITGNNCFTSSLTGKGFKACTDMGTGGLASSANIGPGAVNHWFTMVGNNIPRTNSSSTDVTDTAAQKCVFADNNT